MDRTKGQKENDQREREILPTSSLNEELKKSKRLTVNQLKKFPGLQDISEADAMEISEALFMLAVTFYELYLIAKTKKDEYGKDKRYNCSEDSKES